jgi:diguanylate cyclase (GGDEF)-like protein
MLMAFAYPLLDLAVLVSLVRLAVGGGHHNRSIVLLTLAVATTLLADLVYSGLENQGVVSGVPGWLNALYAVGVVLMTTAALSSDAPRVQTPDRVATSSLSPGRLIALAAGSIALPLLIVLGVGSGQGSGTAVLAAGAVAINVLIVWRSLLVMAFIQRQRDQLASFARTDALTGLPNRRSWDHEVRRAEAWADQLSRPLVVAMLDLDHFKTVNDRDGHQAGDDMLRACADAWRQSLPQSAYLARYGGEEFAILLTDTDRARAERVLEALRAATPDGMTVSVGFAQWTPGSSVVDTLAAADAALYAAKAHGRNVVVGASVTFGAEPAPAAQLPTTARPPALRPADPSGRRAS